MIQRFVAAVGVILFAQLALAQADQAPGNYIRLVDPLDEPEFYCLDLAGWGAHLQLDDPLQTHTCKGRGADDQMIQFTGDQLQATHYGRCIQAAGSGVDTLAGSAVLARTCSDSPLQKFKLEADGRIRLTGTNFCLGAGINSTEASGPSHMWRTHTVQNCDDATAALSTWQIGLS